MNGISNGISIGLGVTQYDPQVHTLATCGAIGAGDHGFVVMFFGDGDTVQQQEQWFFSASLALQLGLNGFDITIAVLPPPSSASITLSYNGSTWMCSF